MGTSAISWGALLKAKATNQKLPQNVAIDKNGNPTTDPSEAMDGSVLGFDHSYKSSGLSMVVELFAGLFTGAGIIDIKEKENDWGNFFLAISPDLLTTKDEFVKKMATFVDRIKHAKTKDGQPVRISGENTLSTRDKNLTIGEIEVADELIQQAKEIANKKVYV